MDRLKRLRCVVEGWVWDNRLFLIAMVIELGVFGAGVITGAMWRIRR